MKVESRQDNFEVLIDEHSRVPVKSWTRGVPFDDNAKQQLLHLTTLPFIHKWVAAMPDVHMGKGATIGSVIPTIGAVIPAAVGVDLGCGMMAVKTSLHADDLPDSMAAVRSEMEKAVPHGRSFKTRGGRDQGSWGNVPEDVSKHWSPLDEGFKRLCDTHDFIAKANHINHLGTLGTGNHFIEICLDQDNAVWVMLHSGSRGVGNAIGSYFIKRAQKDMQRWFINLPDKDLAYIPEGSELFAEYLFAVGWAQDFARTNREVMMRRILQALQKQLAKPFSADVEVINCHHNYIRKEHHYDKNVWVTRKGAVSARLDEMGIIPGSMGAKSFIVRGLGNEQSFCSCSHGAGRVMSRTQAKKEVSLDQHIQATAGVECRKDSSVLDETPAAYKSIEQVMQAQHDLVEIVHTLKQIVCVKG